jgi:hypothetical protein
MGGGGGREMRVFGSLKNNVRFEVFTAVTMKNCVFCDVTLCGSDRTDVSEKLSFSIIRVTRIGELRTKLEVTNNRRTLRNVRRLLVMTDFVLRSPIFSP